MSRPRDEEFDCPVCGETVPAGAKSCPECGACGKSGWSGEAHLDGVDLPDEKDDFDYDRWVDEELNRMTRPRRRAWIWWGAAALVLAAWLALEFCRVGLLFR
jgi:hypothetical protein